MNSNLVRSSIFTFRLSQRANSLGAGGVAGGVGGVTGGFGGVGGVGGYAVEVLARSGVGAIDVIIILY